MQAEFKYEPACTIEKQVVDVEHAHFRLVVRNNGKIVNMLQAKGSPIVGNSISLVPESSAKQTWKEEGDKLVIRLDHCGVYKPVDSDSKLIAAKLELPELLKKVPHWFASNRVDLLTGEPMDKFTVEYEFIDRVETKTIVQWNKPARVYFHCSVPMITEQVAVGDLVMRKGYESHVSQGKWIFDRPGWISVPPNLGWTVEQIETAFRDLAKVLLAKGQIPDLKVWKFKKTTKIQIE